jgi:16S rRNA processing protein RimM
MAEVHDDMLLVGVIVAPFGLRGQVKLRSFTDRPDHLCRQVRTLYVGRDRAPMELRQAFEHKPGVLILSLERVATREAAEDLRGSEVFIRDDDAAPLEEGEYFLHELYGILVVNEDGATIGRVKEVLTTGAGDILVVAREQKTDGLIPLVHDFVVDLDLQQGRITIREVAGLL